MPLMPWAVTATLYERVFSPAKNTWKIESAQLQVKTLKTIIFVKNNYEFQLRRVLQFLEDAAKVILRQMAFKKNTIFKEPLET